MKLVKGLDSELKLSNCMINPVFYEANFRPQSGGDPYENSLFKENCRKYCEILLQKKVKTVCSN
jgi:hypothetical protein